MINSIIGRMILGFLLFVILILETFCTTVDSDPFLVSVHSIDSLVAAYNQKLEHVQPRKTRPDDSNIVHENYSVVTCYKKIDSTMDKIVLNEQHSLGTATDFYFINGSIALATFYRAKGRNLTQVGKRYFENDSEIFVISNDFLPSPSSTLKQADSIKQVCVVMLSN